MGKRRNFIPKQNTHDLLVGTLSIGMPSNNNKNGVDNSRQVTIFKKWTTTISLRQDMFRSFNDHLQL